MYEQLYRYIKKLIHLNELFANEKMPSKRKLATHLKISQVTVESAYQQLLAEGYLRSIPKSGFYVEPSVHHFFDDHSQPKEETTSQKPKKEIYLYDFKTNVVDSRNSPYNSWVKLEKEVVLETQIDLINQMDSQGVKPLREQIASYLYQFRGIKTTPDRIIVGAGSEFLIGLLILILGKESEYALEDPGYTKIQKLYQAYGAKTNYIFLDEQGFSLELLKQTKANIIHVSPSHQFPSGKVIPIARRIALLKWAQEKDNRYIIEDDYDSEFRFSGNPIPAMQGLDYNGKVIYLNSFSKSIAPTLRISFMVLPESLLHEYNTKFKFISNTVPVLNQLILSRFIEKGLFERHLNKMKGIYKEKRNTFIELIKHSKFGPVCKVIGEEAGLHFLLEFPNNVSEEWLIERAKKEKIRIYGLKEYFNCKTNRPEFPAIVMGYSNFLENDFISAIKLLERAWKKTYEII